LFQSAALSQSRLVEAWRSTGWTGPDAEQVQVVDYLVSRLEGRNQAAIGYQIFVKGFMAMFNVADPRYQVGADFDLLLRHRYGVSNTNHCAEGVSPDDEFRIVQISPSSADPERKEIFAFPLADVSVSCNSSDLIRCSNAVIGLKVNLSRASILLYYALTNCLTNQLATLREPKRKNGPV